MKKVFLVGVGGAGVSALAKYLNQDGYEILGSDEKRNENIDKLIDDYNLHFFPEHREENISEDIDFLIYSPAVPKGNPERKKARELGIREYSYPEYLGEISKEKFTVSIAGTNGKTTTTTMTAELLVEFGKDPTVVIGGVAKKFNSNFVSGKSDIFLVESCEYKGSFLHLHPNIIAITNITPDHLDHFGSFENYKKVFVNFLERAKGEQRVLICDFENENLKEVVEKARELNFKIIDYKKYEIEKLSLPGEYNRENARVALAVADYFALDLERAKKYLAEEFQGAGKRFDFLGEDKKGLKIYDDYAHNPEALEVLWGAIKEKFPRKKNILVFQPHLFSRTEDFFDDFVRTLISYDIVYLLPIYKAREKEEDFSIDSRKLFKALKDKNPNTFFCEDFSDCAEKIRGKNYGEDYVLFTGGAGEAEKVAKKLLK